MTGAEAIAAMLHAQGAEYLFTYPDHLLVEPSASLGIRPVMPRTERTAIAMADGYARMTNGSRPSVVAVQYGPGIESSFGAVAQAYSDSSPILLLCGHTPLARLGQEPSFDAVANFRGITKWAARPESAARVPELVRRALTLVRNGRPGPVLLDLPLEAVVGECDPAEVARFGAVPRWRSCADPSDVERVAAALLDAERPVVQAGQGVLYSDASEELVELAELLGLPVMTTLAGKSAFPEDHALSLGSAGLAWPRAVSELVERADFLLAVGASLTASQFAFPVPPGKRVAQVVVDERDVNKDYPIEFALLGDAKLVLRQLVDEVKRRRDADAAPPNGRAIPSAIRAAKQEDEREWGPRLASDEVPISPYRVIAEVAKATSGLATVVTHDSGRPRDQVSAFWESRSPRSYLGWGKSTQLGHGLGLIMGAKLAAPEKLAINFMGDAAIGMVGMELESAARLEIPILTVVLNNKGMSHYENRYPIANRRYGFKALGGDYCAVAKALGVVGEYVDEPSALRAALDRAIEAVQGGRPVLLEVATKEEAAVSQPRESTFIPRWAEVRAEGRLLDARA